MNLRATNKTNGLRNRYASKALLAVVCVISIACGIRQPDLEKLQSENDSLAQLLATKDSSVRIRNTVVNELPSAYTKVTYDIYVAYPPNYKNTGKKYPVLVVLDAEVNFAAVNYIVQRLTKDELIPDLFIVGIAYKGDTDEDTYYSLRSRDFTPTEDKVHEQRHTGKFRSGTGGAENFAKFLSQELFPYLTNHYPVDQENKSVYGHSFGGLFGFHVLLNHPALFDNYLLLSPSLWWDQRKILKDMKPGTSVASKKTRLYVGTGSLEDTMVDDHREVVDLLKHLNSDSLIMKSEILDQETHRTVFGRGFTNGLRFIYAKD